MIHLIYNPVAGKGKARRFRASVEERLKALGVAYCICETQGKRDATRIARELTEKGETEIVAMGGDGTLNEVLNGMKDPSKVRLGVIPCGSGNDYAAAMNIPSTPEGAVDVLVNGAPKAADYLECGGVRGLNIIGAGIDTDILKRCYRAKLLKGSANYFVSLLRSLVRYECCSMSAAFNGKLRKTKAMIVCACNGKRFGGGIRICPDAQPDDGLMDVVLVENVPRSRVLLRLIDLMRGDILQQKCTLHELTDRLRVDFAEPTTIQIDGELYDDLPFDVKLVRGGINVYQKA